jgi:hypothetical protein
MITAACTDPATSMAGASAGKYRLNSECITLIDSRPKPTVPVVHVMLSAPAQLCQFPLYTPGTSLTKNRPVMKLDSEPQISLPECIRVLLFQHTTLVAAPSTPAYHYAPLCIILFPDSAHCLIHINPGTGMPRHDITASP